MRLKYSVLILLVTALTISAAASGGAGASRAPASSASATQGNIFVAYVDGSCANSWRVTVRAELEAEVKKHPEVGKFVYKCAEGNLAKGISIVQSLTAQRVDILLTFADWGQSFRPALRRAYKQGVAVVPWGVPVGGKAGQDYTAFVSSVTAPVFAKFAGNYFIKKLRGKGNVLLMSGVKGNDFDNAYNRVIASLFRKSAPGVKVLEVGWADWNPAKAAQVMSTMLAKYGDKTNAVSSVEATTVKPIIDQFLAAGVNLPVVVSFDVNGMMRDFLKLKPKHPTLEWGFLSAVTFGVRNTLKIGLAAHAGKKWDPSLTASKTYITDCATACKRLYDRTMPDSWIPSSKVPKAVLRPLLGK